MNIGEYKLSLNKENGEISLKLQETDDVHEIEEHLLEKGKFTIIDKETKEVLLNNSQVKNVKIVYGASREDQTTTVIYLQVNFNKEGAKKLEEISQIYVEDKTTEKDEDGEEKEVDNTKYVSVVLDGQTINSTYFGEKMSTGILNIPINQAKDIQTLQTYLKEVNQMATVINTGLLPIEYNFDETIEHTSINENNLIIGIAIPAAINATKTYTSKLSGALPPFFCAYSIGSFKSAIIFFNLLCTAFS